MKPSLRFKAFVLLTLALLLASVGWAYVRYRADEEQRQLWNALVETIASQKVEIDSLRVTIDDLETVVQEAQDDLGAMEERIGHYERGAVDNRLPTPAYRRYLSTIDRHNEIVSEHNAVLVELQNVYREYSQLVDAHNALIDSANAFQRFAVQEGISLPPADFD